MTTTLTPRDCYERMTRGEAIDLVDVRTPAEFDALHATAARSVPLDALAAMPPAGVGVTVALLCKSGARATKGRVALSARGHERVVVIDGGTEAWAAAGLPCVRGASRVPSLERQVRIAAGSLVVVGTLLAYVVSPAWLIVSMFVGCGLVFGGITDTCGMGMALARMPWNRR